MHNFPVSLLHNFGNWTLFNFQSTVNQDSHSICIYSESFVNFWVQITVSFKRQQITFKNQTLCCKKYHKTLLFISLQFFWGKLYEECHVWHNISLKSTNTSIQFCNGRNPPQTNQVFSCMFFLKIALHEIKILKLSVNKYNLDYKTTNLKIRLLLIRSPASYMN